MNYAKHLRLLRAKVWDYPGRDDQVARVLAALIRKAVAKEKPRPYRETSFDRIYGGGLG